MSKDLDNAYYPKEGFVLTHFLTVKDVKRSEEFYLRVFEGQVVRGGEPTIIQIANSWIVLNQGGGPTNDKPTVTQYANEPRRGKQISGAATMSGEKEELDSLLNQKNMN